MSSKVPPALSFRPSYLFPSQRSWFKLASLQSRATAPFSSVKISVERVRPERDPFDGSPFEEIIRSTPKKMFLARVIRKSAVAVSPVKQQCKLYSHHAPSRTTVHPSGTIPLGSLRFCSDSPPKCWNCDYVYKSELFCSKCKTLQELPQNLNYFDIMGIKRDYSVVNEEIHKKYRELQKMLHPDKFSNRSEKERQISEKLSSLINKAYSTLAHPLKRGLYMLQLKGISIPEGTTSLNPEFLMEIMERNEEIENAIEDKDKVLKLAKESKELLNTMSKQVAEAFSKEDIETATKILIKMKYYDTVNNRLKKLKHDLGIVE